MELRNKRECIWGEFIFEHFEVSILHSGWEIQAEVLKRVWVSEENHGFGGHQTIGGGWIHKTGEGYPGTVRRGMMKFASSKFSKQKSGAKIEQSHSGLKLFGSRSGRMSSHAPCWGAQEIGLGKWQVAPALKEDKSKGLSQKTEASFLMKSLSSSSEGYSWFTHLQGIYLWFVLVSQKL